MYYLYVGDTFVLPTLTAYDHEGGVEVNVIYNNININNIGNYEVHYSASNEQGTTTYIIYVNVFENAPEPELMPYYASVEGKSGSDLLIGLGNIISSYKPTSYDAARDILQISDADVNKSGNIILVYNRASVKSTWDNGATWNREHVWPQSFLNGASASDIHNLKPANNSINSSRGNNKFADGNGTYGHVSGGWYPGDDDRGDIARIIFYMVTRYEQLEIQTMGNLQTFIKWHNLDPVDDFERNRNDVLFTYQENRNPYIDYPEFVDSIWGSYTNNFYNEFNTIVDYLTNNIEQTNYCYNNDLYLENRKYIM